jgi:hypothetical protein
MEKSSLWRHTAIRLLKGCNKIHHREQFLDDTLPALKTHKEWDLKNKKGQTMLIKALFWPS